MPDERELRKRLGPYLKKLGNPYAWLSFADHYEGETTNLAVSSSNTLRGISKKEFRAACKRIFRQYIPAAGPSRFESHHQEFIARNENRTPIGRAVILNALQRYDLSGIPGFQGRFNRNLLALGREKLEAIERQANDMASLDE